jgi:hypothetical protein
MDCDNSVAELLNLPPELLEHILSFLDPYELVAFGLVCKYTATIISPSNQPLWRHAFLHIFDDPYKAWSALLPSARSANAINETSWNWHSKTRERCMALKAVTTTNKVYRRQNLDLTTNALVDIIETAYSSPPTNLISNETPVDYERRQSISIRTLQEAFLMSRDAEKTIHDFTADYSLRPSIPPELLFPHPGRPITRSMVSERKHVSENASKLHTFFGPTKCEKRSDYAQGQARCIVYDWHLTGPETDYGPYKDIKSGQWGQVNWRSLEAVSSLITQHMELLASDHMTFPQGFKYALPYQMPVAPARPEDWAGVTGNWLGTYSFLDWTVLHHFNVHVYENGGRMSLDACDEARGDLMHLELHLDDSVKTDPRLATKMPVCEDLPVLYFKGTSRGTGATRPYIQVRGTASLIPGARQVRWRFIIRSVDRRPST